MVHVSNDYGYIKHRASAFIVRTSNFMRMLSLVVNLLLSRQSIA
jgi:hypothetical protein